MRTHYVEEGRACARCGSDADGDDCEWCPATGWYEDNDPDCHACHGTGIHWICGSSAEWCQANPRPGHEHVQRGEFEDWSIEVPLYDEVEP